MGPEVYCVPVGARWLVFAPLHSVAAVVNASAVEGLRAALRGGTPLPHGAALADLGEALAADRQPPPVPQGPARPPFLGLILTRGCNLGCRYCGFAAEADSETMSPELVSQAVSGWVEWVRSLGGEWLDLHFFGGEPFTQPDLVEIAVHRARYLADRHGMGVRVEATTNGVLGRRMRGFVQDHFDALVLSLDGRAEDHDRHRPTRTGAGSFREAWSTAEALSASHVKLCLRVCVSEANVAGMAQTAEWLCRSLWPDTLTFEPMKPTPQALAAGLRAPGVLPFARGFLAAWRVARELGVPCVYAPLYEQPRRAFCPVGQDTFIVAPDLSVRSCYLRRREWEACGLDMQVGQVERDGTLALDAQAAQRLREGTVDRPRCRRCFCRWSCAGGCVVEQAAAGRPLEYTDFCRQTRLLQACVLLDGLGLAPSADDLLADDEAAQRLQGHADDRLEASAE